MNWGRHPNLYGPIENFIENIVEYITQCTYSCQQSQRD